eukprot:1955788-Prymnesium_polylepis.1
MACRWLKSEGAACPLPLPPSLRAARPPAPGPGRVRVEVPFAVPSTMTFTGAHRQSAICGLGARCELVPCSKTIAEKRRGHVPPATGLRGAGVGPMK